MPFARYPVSAVLVVSALALLPFGRMVEIPLGLLSIIGAALLWRRPVVGMPWRILALLLIAFWLPQVMALPDAVEPGKSLRTTVGTLRYALSCFALLALVALADDPRLARDTTLRATGSAAAVLLALWCLDGLWQFLTGFNVLGYALDEHYRYVNGVFGEQENIKFGITVALLAPLALVHALRQWPVAAAVALTLLVLALVILSGKRGAWVALAVELVALGAYYLARGRLALSSAALVAAAAALVLASSFLASDWVRQRSTVIMEAVEQPDFDTVNRATGLRLPIWGTALRMGRDHWLNGVGPRGFRYAYTDYAHEGDRWAEPLGDGRGASASHAHQILLDLWCETGVIGLAGYLALVTLLAVCWRRASAAARARALPFAVSLLGMLFPVNTHPAFYSSWSALLLWLLLGLFLVALTGDDTTRTGARGEGA